MTDKIWAWHPSGTVAEIVSLPSDWVPGVNIYSAAHAADMTDVTTLNPQPAVTWTTADGGKTFAAPPAPVPAEPPTQYDFLGFLNLFTATEQGNIVGSTDARVKLFCLMAAGASFVDRTDPRVVQGTKLLETLGLIAAGRAASILAGQAAPAS